MVSADDSRGIQEALTTAASVLTRIGASLPLTNDEDPKSSPYDLDGWLDDFAVADWDTIFSQAGILFTSVGSVDWTTIGDPFTDPYGDTTNLPACSANQDTECRSCPSDLNDERPQECPAATASCGDAERPAGDVDMNCALTLPMSGFFNDS